MCRCWLGHNVAPLTRPNCFGWYFFRLKRFSEIGLAVFPEAKWFSGQNFRVKNEIQNSISEFASRYGMPVGGSATGSAGRRPAPRRPARPPRPARRPARQAGRQAQARSKAGSARARVNVRKPAPVAAGFKQKARRPRKAQAGKGKGRAIKRRPRVVGKGLFHARNDKAHSYPVTLREFL